MLRSSIFIKIIRSNLSLDLANRFLDLSICLSYLLQLSLKHLFLLLVMIVLCLQLFYLLSLYLYLIQQTLSILSIPCFESLKLRHLYISTVNKIGTQCLKSGKYLFFFFFLLWICVVQDTEITGTLFVY